MSPRITLALTSGAPNQVALTLTEQRRGEELAKVERPSSGDLVATLREAVGEVFEQANQQSMSRVDVLLCPPFAQIRTLRGLPPVRGRDLVRLVDEQRHRFFRPVSGEHVISARWRESDENGTVASAAMAEASLLEALESSLAEIGVMPRSIRAASAPAAEQELGVALASPSLQERSRRKRRRHVAGVTTVAVLGWLTPATAYVFDLTRDDAVMTAELAQVDTTLARIDSLQSRVADFAPVAVAFRRQSAASEWATRTLAEVMGDLPGGIHLHGLKLERPGGASLQSHWDGTTPDIEDSVRAAWGGRARIVGDADSADGFTILLDGSP